MHLVKNKDFPREIISNWSSSCKSSMSAVTSDNFIEYPQLTRHPNDWRSKSTDFPSDLDIIVEDGVSARPNVYSVHLRVVSMLSDFLFKIAVKPLDTQTNLLKAVETDLLLEGDIALKLQDGRSFRIGILSQSLCSMKEQIKSSFGIRACEQRLFLCRDSADNQELKEDWRSLAGCGLQKDDTLLLMPREPWQHYDSSSKALTLRLPEICARCLQSPFS